jgi:hypothetical protein
MALSVAYEVVYQTCKKCMKLAWPAKKLYITVRWWTAITNIGCLVMVLLSRLLILMGAYEMEEEHL